MEHAAHMRSAFAKTAPFRPPGTFPRCAEEGKIRVQEGKIRRQVARRREVFHFGTLPLRSGGRWRQPHGGALCGSGSIRSAARNAKRARSTAPFRPSGTFPRSAGEGR